MLHSQQIDARHVPLRSSDCATARFQLLRVDYPQHLNTAAHAALLDEVMDVAVSAFGRDDDLGFRKDVEEHIFSSEGLLLVMDDEQLIGFWTWTHYVLDLIQGTDILYVSGMAIRKDRQNQGIGRELLRQVLKDDFLRTQCDVHAAAPLPESPFVVFRTQSPEMKYGFDQTVGTEIYPRVGSSVPKDVQDVGIMVARELGDTSFDPTTLISRGTYGGSLYGPTSLPSRDDAYGRLFGQINPANGDSIMCVWRRQTTH